MILVNFWLCDFAQHGLIVNLNGFTPHKMDPKPDYDSNGECPVRNSLPQLYHPPLLLDS